MPVSERYHYANEKLANAVFLVMSASGTAKDRLLQAALHDVSVLKATDLPDGRFREDFRELIKRILDGAPAGTVDGLYEAAFRHMTEEDVRWILERLHRLAFAMCEFVAGARL